MGDNVCPGCGEHALFCDCGGIPRFEPEDSWIPCTILLIFGIITLILVLAKVGAFNG
jgi:hypothetical protein